MITPSPRDLVRLNCRMGQESGEEPETAPDMIDGTQQDAAFSFAW